MRSAARGIVDRFQVRGQRPGRGAVAGIVLLQIKIQRDAEAALGEPARTVVAGLAGVGKQPRTRLALIEIFGTRDRARKHSTYAEGNETSPQPLHHHRPRHVRLCLCGVMAAKPVKITAVRTRA